MHNPIPPVPSDPGYDEKVAASYGKRRRWAVWTVVALALAIPVTGLVVAQFRRCGPVPKYDALGVGYSQAALEEMVARGDTLAASDTLFRHPELVAHECAWR